MGKSFTSIFTVFLGAMLLVSCAGTKKSTTDRERTTLKELDRSAYSEYQYALTEATKQKLFGNLKEAASLYQKCIEFNPGSGTAYYQLGNIFTMVRDWGNAVPLYKKAIELEPDNYWFYEQLGNVYNVRERYDSAMMIYEQIIEKWPDKMEVRYELARLTGVQGNEKKAIMMLDQIEEEMGISEPVVLTKHQLWLNRGRPEKAIEELQKLISAVPTEIRYRGMLAELYGTLGRNEEAIREYQEILRIDPASGLTFLSIAEFYKQLDEKEQWLEWTGKAIRNKQLNVDQKIGAVLPFLTDEQSFNAHRAYVDSLCHIIVRDHPGSMRAKTLLADYYVKTEDYVEADSLFDIILDHEKKNYTLWEQSLYIKNMLGRFDALIERAREGQQYFKERPMMYFLPGIAYIQLDKNKEALKQLEQAEKYLGSESRALKEQLYQIMGDTYYSTGQANKTFAYYEKALGINPDNIIVLNNYSYFLAEKETELDKAMEMIEKVILAEPENATYLDTYAWVLFKKERYQEALFYIEAAVEQMPEGDAEVYEHYGDILIKNGRKSEALEYWERALELNPDAEGLMKKLKQHKEKSP